jgi:DNA-binding beta-propeller fold protein YncE
MKRNSIWLPLTAALVLAACSSGNSNSPTPVPPPPAGIAVSGAVFDGPVSGATISAYAVSAAGVVGTTVLATAVTNAEGAYSLTLPAGATGPVELHSMGGTFVDDVTGMTVNAPTLNALIPNVSGSAPITAQLTPLTTIEAAVALASASATNPVSSTAAAIDTAVGTLLGGQTNSVGTPLADVSTAGCATAASQASLDASLVLAGINQLAANNNVSTPDLIAAIVADVQSDNTFDGTANGVPLTVPLSNPNGVLLCTVEGNCPGAPLTGLAQELGAAVLQFQNSPQNTCGATESASQTNNFANAPKDSPQMSPHYKYSYSLNSTVSGPTGIQAGTIDVQVIMSVALSCPDDAVPSDDSNGAHLISSTYPGGGAFSILAGANGEFTEDGFAVGITAPNDCGTNQWTVTLKVSQGLSCNVNGASSGTFTSNDGGLTNVAASPPTVSCSVQSYTVGGTITGLTAGSIVLADNAGDQLTLMAASPPSAVPFTFPTQYAAGSMYQVTVNTQPNGLNCAVSPSTPQTGTGNVSVAVNCTPTSSSTPGAEAIYVIDSTYRLFEFDAQGNSVASVNLPGSTSSIGNLNGGGITVDANNVYVTLGAPSTGVVAFNRTTLAPVTLAAGAFSSNLNTPRGIVFDPINSQFYVANGGSTVTVYNAAGGYLSSFNQSSPAIYGPSGIAYDPIDNSIWVANYVGGTSSTTPAHGISEWNPNDSLIMNFPSSNTNPPMPFAPPVNTGHELPYAMSYCGNALAVGYISDGTGSGISEAEGFSTSGTPLGVPFGGTITNLHELACDPNGNVFVAADNGLLEYTDATGASVALPAGGFAGLKPPIYGVGVGAASGLNSPEGLVYANGSLYIANSGNNQVLVYAIQTNSTTGVVTGMTLSSSITADLNDPVRLALDSAGHLFVANLGNNTVTVYDTNNNNAEITASGKPLISSTSLNRPLGVAVDSKFNVYVANNGGNSISVFQPVTAGGVGGGYTEASFSPVTADASGDLFPAPGVLLDINFGGQDYLLVGIGSSTATNYIYLYSAPFSGPPVLQGDLSSAPGGVACATMPTGPTGIAVFYSQSVPLSSQIFVTSYYNNDVTEYFAQQVLGASGCPATTATGTQINGPEGVAVDTAGVNVFVANAGANTITVYGSGAALTAGPIYTLHN